MLRFRWQRGFNPVVLMIFFHEIFICLAYYYVYVYDAFECLVFRTQ